MSALTGWALRSRAVTIFLMLLVLGAGVFAYRDLHQDMWPDVDYPFVTVVTLYPSANPETVERDVTEPVEEAVEGLSGVKHVRSTSAANQSIVVVEFEFGEDMKEAERNVQSSVNGVTFPAEVKDPIVRRIGSETEPIMRFSVTGGTDFMALQDVVDDVMIPQIEQVDGVLRAEMTSEAKKEVQVTVDAEKLEDLGLSFSQVSTALIRNNQNVPAGDVDHQGRSFPVMTMNRLGSLEDIRNVVVGYEGVPVFDGERRPIRVKDVAEVGLSTPKATSIWRTDGKPGVEVVVFSNPDYSKRETTANVRDGLENMDGLPSGLELAIMIDAGEDAREQLSGLTRDGILGFLLAVVVVFVFLLNFRPSLFKGVTLALRPTLVIATSIPLSVLLGLLLLALAGQTLNFMTIAGLAIAVGRLVDDSIVVLENVYTHLQRGEERTGAAYEATREVAVAIVGTTLVTIVAFLPLAFIQGLVGSYFTPMVMAVSFALVSSTLVALTAVPVLGSILLRQGDSPPWKLQEAVSQHLQPGCKRFTLQPCCWPCATGLPPCCWQLPSP